MSQSEYEKLAEGIPENIRDFVRATSDSTSQALHRILVEVQSDTKETKGHISEIKEGQRQHNVSDDIRFNEIITILKERKEQRKEERDFLIDEIKLAVKNEVKQTVNGKIDKMNDSYKETHKLIEDIKPVLDNYQNTQGFYKTSIFLGKSVIGIGAFIGSLFAIKEFLK